MRQGMDRWRHRFRIAKDELHIPDEFPLSQGRETGGRLIFMDLHERFPPENGMPEYGIEFVNDAGDE